MAADDIYYDCLGSMPFWKTSEEEDIISHYACTKEAYGGLWHPNWYLFLDKKCPLCGGSGKINNSFKDDFWFWEHECFGNIHIDSCRNFKKPREEAEADWNMWCDFVNKYNYGRVDEDYDWITSENERLFFQQLNERR